MTSKKRGAPRREESLSRERIVEASIAILDESGEGGLTFRALAERLATGPGAIYWHVANKSDLLAAACDSLVVRTLENCPEGATPKAALRSLALGMFDAIDAHPWIGSALIHSMGRGPIVRLVERIGQPVRALGVPERGEWAAVSALLSYILGVGAQNAVNGQIARERDIDRSAFLDALAQEWSRLDPQAYPFARSIAGKLRVHDDRADFLAGIDFILDGIEPPKRR